VRAQLKSVGYKTVAFQEEYPLVQFDNSDVLIGTDHPSINSAYLYPFEVMYQQSTAEIILTALDPGGRVQGFIQGFFQNKKIARGSVWPDGPE